MHNITYEIISVYHRHANCRENEDAWARRRLHGLNPIYLQANGFPNESALLTNFNEWIKSFDVICMYANDPSKERPLFPNYSIRDSFLPCWEERMDKPYHIVANRFKDLSIPIAGVRCNAYIHSNYIQPCSFPSTKTKLAKTLLGFHCSLRDVHELYLKHVLDDM